MPAFMATHFFLLMAGPLVTDQNSFLDQVEMAYFHLKPLTAGFAGSPQEGADLGREFAIRLEPHIGEIVGYKAALTSRANRKKFGVKQPILGRLLKRMLLENHTTIPFPFAARPALEGDLLVRVSDEAINRARTKKEALAAIEGFYPFLEIPDLMYKPGIRLDGGDIAAINAGARYGVMGPIFLTQSKDDWRRRLRRIEVVILDSSGKELARGNSRQLMGDPLKAVLWIRDAVLDQGGKLKKGDFLSLGAMTPPVPVKAEGTYRARFTGFGTGEPVEISLVFDSNRN